MRSFSAVLLMGASLALTAPVAASQIELSDAQLDNVTAGSDRFAETQGRVEQRQQRLFGAGEETPSPPPANGDNGGNGANGGADPADVRTSRDGPNVASTVLSNLSSTGGSGLSILARAQRLSEKSATASLDIRVIGDEVRGFAIGSTTIESVVSD